MILFIKQNKNCYTKLQTNKYDSGIYMLNINELDTMSNKINMQLAVSILLFSLLLSDSKYETCNERILSEIEYFYFVNND